MRELTCVTSGTSPGTMEVPTGNVVRSVEFVSELNGWWKDSCFEYVVLLIRLMFQA